jgi:RNA polymerase sigma-70 factor (ECF subfamily)
MSRDVRPVRGSGSTIAAEAPASARRPRDRRPKSAPASEDSRLALEIRECVARGNMDEARDRFAGLVAAHQRRALRIAYQYLRDQADADEAVQDAFVKVFSHITSYREAWPFEVWFTRILINGCLDRRKARARRERWHAPSEISGGDEARASIAAAPEGTPEARLLAQERRARISAAIGRTPREVSAITGLNESTVRVHLFRAARKLRGLLGGKS